MSFTRGFLWGLVLSVSSAAVAEAPAAGPDWLVSDQAWPAEIRPGDEPNTLVMSNGLIQRTFTTTPNFATLEMLNLMTGASLLRGVKPEAVVELDGTRFEVGGLKGQPDYGYLNKAWIPALTANAEAFQFGSYAAGKPAAPYFWEPKRHAPENPWPPRGVTLTVQFAAPAGAPARYEKTVVLVHYALYDNLPVLAKWVTVENGGTEEVVVSGLECEILAVTEQEKDRLHVESNFAFDGMNTTQWGPDAEYTSQINYEYKSPVLMTSRYPLGPGVHLKPGATFTSFRTHELVHDSDDRERRGLARRRLYRALAPQAFENPILMHVRESDSKSIRRAVDQCAETGFEMVICTFWSGFDIESEDPEYIARFKADVDYAHGKGVELGGYTLMCASRDVGPKYNCISPETGQPGSKFGQSACIASAWFDGYRQRVLNFMDATGMDVIETDGPFHGDVCASTEHEHHAGLADSQVAMWSACADFYHECRKRGIYINSPDWYYLSGSNKCAMGYRETNWSLPRDRQIILGRQNIFDGTFEKSPSMGWMFVPLVEYHGGGAAATLEPLSKHLAEYGAHLAQNFGSGVQACYRGPRLYDTDETKAVVKQWVDFYKRHRAILDSDLIHVRRADGNRIDGMLHVNPRLPERGLAMFYNPADREQSETFRLPLYYTGLTDTARVREQDGEPKDYTLARDYSIALPVTIPAHGVMWFVIE